MGTLAPVRGAFRTVTLACIPGAAALDAEGWARAETIVDDALAERPESVRRQLLLFMKVLGVLSVLRFGKGLARLDPARARRLLAALERSPRLLLRRGTWGVRTLAYMGVYTQAVVRRDLGYRAAPEGWEHRRGDQGAWPSRGGAAPPEAGTLTVGDAGVPDAPGGGKAGGEGGTHA